MIRLRFCSPFCRRLAARPSNSGKAAKAAISSAVWRSRSGKRGRAVRSARPPRPLDRPAAAVSPDESVRASPRTGRDDDRRRDHHAGGDDNCVALTTAIGAAVPAGSAASGRIGRGAEAGDRACDQGRGKKILHVLPFLFGPRCGADHVSCRVIRHIKPLRLVDTRMEPSNDDLNAA
jgi:hypothetical protein